MIAHKNSNSRSQKKCEIHTDKNPGSCAVFLFNDTDCGVLLNNISNLKSKYRFKFFTLIVNNFYTTGKLCKFPHVNVHELKQQNREEKEVKIVQIMMSYTYWHTYSLP